MKSIRKSFVLVAAAATALISCEKTDIGNSAENNGIKFSIKAHIDETRTFIEQDGKVYTPKWNKDDLIGVFFGNISSGTKADAEFANVAENGATADFEGTSTTAAEEGTLKAIYPATAIYEGYSDGTIGVTLSGTQNPTPDSFDGTADILVSAPCIYIAIDGEVAVEDLYFSRIMSVVKINLKSDFAAVQGENVKSVTMTAPDAVLTGRAKVDFDTREVQEWTVKTDNVKASYDAANAISVNGEKNAVYLVINPTAIASGKELTFDIETEHYSISKTVSLSKDMVLPKGDIAVINLTILEENCTVKEAEADFSGEWVIYGENNNSKQVAIKYESGNNIKGTNVTLDGETIIPSDLTKIADAKMTIAKVTEGTYAGLYTIKDAGGLYLTATSTAASGSNYLQGKAETALAAGSYWAITEKDGAFTITAPKIDQKYAHVMQFNTSSALFSCYTSASQKPVKLYPWANVRIPKTINAADEIQVGAAGKEAELIEYTTSGIEAGAEITATCDGTVVNYAEIDDTHVLYSFTSNYGAEAREGKITLTLASDDTVKKEIAVKQAGSKLAVSVAEITIPATENTNSFTVTSDVFGGTIVIGPNNTDITIDKTTFVAGESATTVTVTCNTPAAAEEQIIATITVSRTENDPQAKTVTVKKAAEGALPQLNAPTGITVSDISASGFKATWNADESASGYAYKLTAVNDVNAEAVAEGDNIAENSVSVTATLTEGATYYLYVKSLGTEGVSATSEWSPAVEVVVPKEMVVTFTFDAGSGQKDGISKTDNVITCIANTGAGSNAPNEHAKDKALRFYAKNTMTISGATITKVEFTFSTNKTLSASVGSYNTSTGIWTGSASSVTFTNTDSAQAKIKSVTITYKP
ncbi:MAG: hypothetical protein J6K28_01970 [Alistipes sp.]|nr:hypothetical protein [Alistipes sp.]